MERIHAGLGPGIALGEQLSAVPTERPPRKSRIVPMSRLGSLWCGAIVARHRGRSQIAKDVGTENGPARPHPRGENRPCRQAA